MKFLITGASGFLGKHLSTRLEKDGHEVTKLSSSTADLTRPDSLYQFNDTKFDQVFHLAAWTQPGSFCDVRRGEQWIVNQQINTHVLAWWKEFQPQAKMIALGTSISYTTEVDLEETKYMDGIPTDKFYAYAMCKRMMLAGLQCLQKQFGMTYLYLIPSTLYGPGYHTDERQLHFIYDLIRKILRGKMYDEPVILWGDGEQRRELVYVHDFIEMMLSLNKVADNELFNIGSGKDHSIKEFAAIICEQVEYDAGKIRYDTNQYTGAKSKILDIRKMQGALNSDDLNAVTLEQGIADSIAWMKNHKDVFLQQ